jgi:hypothetical protein
MNLVSKRASAALLATTIVAVPSWAGAAPVNAGAMKSANAHGGVIQARWAGHRFGWGPGAVVGGIAAGIAGAAIADGAYGYYAPYGPYAYDEPGYVYGYGPYWGGPYWRYRHWHHW